MIHATEDIRPAVIIVRKCDIRRLGEDGTLETKDLCDKWYFCHKVQCKEREQFIFHIQK